MLVPALVFFTVFGLVPLVGTVVLSFYEWNGLGTPNFSGLDNWTSVLQDSSTYHALWLTILMCFATFVVQFPISLLLGVFMAGRQRYRGVLAVLYFLPLLFSATAIGIAFKNLLDPNFGLSSALHLGVLQQDWLGSPVLAFWVVIAVVSWCFIPFHSLLYQAGARQIPQTLYEAAQLDGAGRVRCFFSITLPQLKYTMVTSTTLMIVGTLTAFDLIYVMTNGGPGDATRVLPVAMYLEGFKSNQMGVASVIAVILIVLGLSFSLLLNRLSGSDRMESQMEGA
ncbi:carbohydrate ABC transporter permease [Flexivirga alba]|uniref:Carbohydrate ABC transporter permease n=1 Tax=Flexivirga alba TaxID=702742 RepID=A0ABW2AMB2_9MICO